MKNRSKKRAAEEVVYSNLRKKFLSENPMCSAHLPGICTQYAFEVHHTKGRIGTDYLDVSTWIGLCSSCHKYIENHPEEAKSMGFSKNRLRGKNDLRE